MKAPETAISRSGIGSSGEMNACTSDGWSLATFWPLCFMTRSDIFYVQLLAADWWKDLGVTDTSRQKQRSTVCRRRRAP